MRAPEWAKGIEARATRIRRRFDPIRQWVERSILWQIWERVLENEFARPQRRARGEGVRVVVPGPHRRRGVRT